MFTITDFEDLVRIIDSRPEWRQRLKHALFPETDLEIALRELAESGKRHDKASAKLESSQARLESSQARLESGQEELRHDLKSVKTDIAKLKGRSQEDFYRQRADSVFGVQLRKGLNATGWIADLLYEKVAEGIINLDEVKQVLAADLLWSAETRDSKMQVVVVMEASWYAEEGDIKRALSRANILRRVGVKAIPVVGGEAWSDSAKQTAADGNVVTTENGRLDEAAWSQALQTLA